MRKLGQRVCLIHKLRQGRGTEKFLNCRCHRPDVDQALRCYNIEILKCHSLTDDSLHTAESDTELVLQEFTDAADTAVAEMVDIVTLCQPVCKAVEVVDRTENIICNNVLRDQNLNVLPDSTLQGFGVISVLLGNTFHDNPAHLFANPEFFLHVFADVLCDVNHAVVHHAYALSFYQHINGNNTAVGHCHSLFPGEEFPFFRNNFAGKRVNNRLCQLAAGDTRIKSLLLVKLEAADVGDLITAAIIEQPVKEAFCRFYRGRIARTKFAVNLNQAFFPALCRILLDRRADALIFTENLPEAFIRHCSDSGVLNAGEPC